LPSYSLELNPDEQVWNMVNAKEIGKKTSQGKSELRKKVESALRSLQNKTETVKSFFQLPYTKYAELKCADNC
jgi:hypothetical protein